MNRVFSSRWIFRLALAGCFCIHSFGLGVAEEPSGGAEAEFQSLLKIRMAAAPAVPEPEIALQIAEERAGTALSRIALEHLIGTGSWTGQTKAKLRDFVAGHPNSSDGAYAVEMLLDREPLVDAPSAAEGFALKYPGTAVGLQSAVWLTRSATDELDCLRLNSRLLPSALTGYSAQQLLGYAEPLSGALDVAGYPGFAYRLTSKDASERSRTITEVQTTLCNQSGNRGADANTITPETVRAMFEADYGTSEEEFGKIAADTCQEIANTAASLTAQNAGAAPREVEILTRNLVEGLLWRAFRTESHFFSQADGQLSEQGLQLLDSCLLCVNQSIPRSGSTASPLESIVLASAHAFELKGSLTAAETLLYGLLQIANISPETRLSATKSIVRMYIREWQAYDSALAFLDLPEEQKDAEVKLLQGIALMNLERYDEARTSFSIASRTANDARVREQSDLLLGYSEGKLGRAEDKTKLWKDLASNANDSSVREVARMLRKSESSPDANR